MWIAIAIVVLLVILVISMYNNLVRLRQKVKILGVKLMFNYKEDLI